MVRSEQSVEESLTVLVVEDNPGDVRLIETGFEQSDVKSALTVVNDGREALRYLGRNESRSAPMLDLVLLDLNLPKITGREVLERSNDRADLASIPMVVLSGSQTEEHVLEARRLGAAEYFVKPVDPHEFMSLVEGVAESMGSSRTLPDGEFSKEDRLE